MNELSISVKLNVFLSSTHAEQTIVQTQKLPYLVIFNIGLENHSIKISAG
jgi:hypothetical protein